MLDAKFVMEERRSRRASSISIIKKRIHCLIKHLYLHLKLSSEPQSTEETDCDGLSSAIDAIENNNIRPE